MFNTPLRDLFVGALACFISVSLYAAEQNKVSPEPLLQRLFEQALTNNPTLQVAEAQQKAAESNIQLAESQQQLSVYLQSELSYAWMQKKEFARIGNEIRASYPVYQPDLSDQFRVAKHRASSTKGQLQSQRQMLLRSVAETYYQYRSQQAQVEYLAKERRSIETILSQVEQRLQLGYQNLSDVADIRARLDKNRDEQLFAQQQLNVIAANLTVFIGQSVDLSKWQSTMDLPQMTQAQYRVALANIQQHPELSTLQWAKKAAQEQAVLAKNKDGVRLEAFSAYVYNDSDGNFYDDMQGLKGGIQISLPLYLAGQTDEKVALARAESSQLSAKYRDKERSLSAQAKSAWLVFQTGIKRLDALKSVLASSEQALQATENGLTTGNRNMLDLLNAQRRHHLAERDLPMLKAQTWQAWYQLHWALGRLDYGGA